MAEEQWYAVYEDRTGELISTGTEVRSLHEETLDDVIKNEGGETVVEGSSNAGSQPSIPAQLRPLKEGTKLVAIDGQPGPDDVWDTESRSFKKVAHAAAGASRPARTSNSTGTTGATPPATPSDAGDDSSGSSGDD